MGVFDKKIVIFISKNAKKKNPFLNQFPYKKRPQSHFFTIFIPFLSQFLLNFTKKTLKNPKNLPANPFSAVFFRRNSEKMAKSGRHFRHFVRIFGRKSHI
jgi:hypothetical protein